MAIRYAVAAGNWSDAATWDGGASIPASGDYVYANGYNVALDTDVALGVGTLSTEICPTTSVGGGVFNYSASRTIVANIIAGTSACVVGTTSGKTITIVGNVTGGSTGNAYGLSVYCRSNSTTSVVNIYGDIIGGSNSSAHGIFHNTSTGSNQNIQLNLTGNITGTVANGMYANASSVGTLNSTDITGNVTAGSAAAITSVSGTVAVAGICTASSTAPCFTAYNSSVLLIFSGAAMNSGAQMAFDSFSRIYFSPTSQTAWTFYDNSGAPKALYTADVIENPPAESDVRDGVVYGIGDAYTGTLDPGATASEIVAALVASDLGLRMAKCAVTEEVLTMLENLK